MLDEQIHLYGHTEKSIEETIRRCLDKNILKEYLESRESEVHDIMFTLFDEEKYRELYLEELKEDAQAEGREEGRAEGMEKSLISSIKNIMESLNISVDKAMDALKIPNEKREYYKTQVMEKVL